MPSPAQENTENIKKGAHWLGVVLGGGGAGRPQRFRRDGTRCCQYDVVRSIKLTYHSGRNDSALPVRCRGPRDVVASDSRRCRRPALKLSVREGTVKTGMRAPIPTGEGSLGMNEPNESTQM